MWKSVLFLCVLIHQSIGGAQGKNYQRSLELQSVKLFREYIQIDTSKEENIQKAVDFWERQVSELGIPYVVHEPAGLPIFVATLKGSNPKLPSIMLNSHMDVVTADASEWKYPPFDAHIDKNGDIYGRGTQDTKDVGIQYLEAIRRLIKDNVTLSRTLHMTLMPDEETGGRNGMKAFSKSEAFKTLNIGFALDEGFLNSEDNLLGTYVDRRPWQIKFVISGVGGHGSQMPDDSAMEKTQRFINAVMAYRAQQKQIVQTKHPTDFTGYTSVNINMLNGGLAINIIPTKITLIVDMRLSTDADIAEMDSLVNSWIDAAGNNTEVTYIQKVTESRTTPVDDTNPFWLSLRDTLKNMGIKIVPIVRPGVSDIQVLRNLGIPAIGFSTKTRTKSRFHAKDEYQNVKIFLKGIDIYTEVIKNLANVPSNC